MNKLCCLIVMFITCGVCKAQNLVQNPSFEDTVSCPIGPDEMDKSVGWSSYSYSPDYMHSCSMPGSVSVPDNWGGYQQAATGNAYGALAGFGSGWIGPNVREFIGGHLLQPLSIGTKYYVSFKISLTINSGILANCACNKMGAMFSTVTYDVFNPAQVTNSPPIYSDSLITDSVNWTRISGSFIADSSYQYIIIGNFFSNNNTDTLVIDDFDGSHLCYGAYYYLDDVCVSTDSLNCNSPTGLQQIKQIAGLSLFPNPFSDKLNITIKRNELVEISLFDVTSRKIFNQTFTNSISINTEQLAKGIYLYEVRNKNGVIKKGKVVKN
ncbi:MAG TPA: T9SS type A sorting domain-containing protein [Bacteroidia bacterium]|nr:T9SS type A sorting domain-containing protein [Bacteroidia bacterium]